MKRRAFLKAAIAAPVVAALPVPKAAETLEEMFRRVWYAAGPIGIKPTKIIVPPAMAAQARIITAASFRAVVEPGLNKAFDDAYNSLRG